jgi:CRP-like cAMP-binding protein
VPKQITFPTREQMRMLSGVDFLKPLSEEELEKLAQRCPNIYFQPKEIISTPADHDDRFFILKHGRVRIYKIGPKGNEQTVAEISDGTVLTTRRLQETYAQALEPTTVVPMTLEDMERLIDSNPKVGMRVIEALCRHLRTADKG